MKNNDLISVIIPIYNVEKFLSFCIDSIVNQTYKNLEIILVDDGSTDNSGKICDEYALKDNRIKVMHKQNGGVSSARNVGLNIAKGKYIGFVDSDDYVENDMFEILHNLIIKNNVDISCCNKFVFKKNKFTASKNFPNDTSLLFNEVLNNPKHDFYVTVTVSNSGDERGTATVSLSVDGQAVGNKSISVKYIYIKVMTTLCYITVK